MAEISPALRESVRERADRRCEYCLIPESLSLVSHQVDHVIALKHGGATDTENLALSRALCNKCKGGDIASLDPLTGQLHALFHPRKERWADHFRFTGPEISPLTATGRVTVRILQLNRSSRLAERARAQRIGLISPSKL